MNKSIVERLREFAENGSNDSLGFCDAVNNGDGSLKVRDLAASIADQVEREYLPRPRFEDGSIVRRGDKVLYNGKPFDVQRIRVDDDGEFYFKVDNRVTNWFDKTQRMKRPEPEVLDADGVPIKVGDTVYSMDGHVCKVTEIERYDYGVQVVADYDGGTLYGGGGYFTRDYFAHKPDTQECINEDATKSMLEYWGCSGIGCGKCPALIDGKRPYEFYGVNGCEKAMILELLAREKKLYERKAK